MKILLLTIIATISFSSEIKWLNYNQSLKSKEDKPILFVLSASYCEFCKRDMKMIAKEKNLSEYIERNFIPVYMERDIDYVPSYLDSSFTPIYYILDKKGQIVDTIRGSQAKDSTKFAQFLSKNLYKWRNK